MIHDHPVEANPDRSNQLFADLIGCFKIIKAMSAAVDCATCLREVICGEGILYSRTLCP